MASIKQVKAIVNKILLLVTSRPLINNRQFPKVTSGFS